MKTTRILRLLIAFLFIVGGGLSQAQTTIDAASPYAYSANAGWINFRADGASGGRGE